MKKDTLTNTVLRNSIFNGVTSVLNKIGVAIFTIIIARVLLPESYGIYSLAISISSIFWMLADLGINNALITYVSRSFSEKRPDKAAAYFQHLLKIKIYLAVGIFILISASAYPLAVFAFKKPALFLPLIISGVYTFLMGIDSVYSSLFFSINKVKYLGYREAVYQFLRILFVTILFLIIPAAYYVSGVIAALILSTVSVIFLSLFWLKKFSPGLFRNHNVKIDKKEILQFIFYLAIANVSAVFLSYVDTLLLGIMIPDASYVGFYRAAFSIVLSICSIFTFSSILLPVFSSMKKQSINYSFNKVLKYTLMFAIPAALGLVALGRYFIRFLYGYEYLQAAIPLYFLSFVIIETSVTSLYYSILASNKKPQLYSKMIIYSTIVNVILNFLFIYYFLKFSPILAVAGAAAATLISRIFYLAGMAYLSKREMGLTVERANVFRPLASGLIMYASLILFTYLVKDINIYWGVFGVLMGASVYFIFLFIFGGIKREERYLFGQTLRLFTRGIGNSLPFLKIN